MTAALELAGLKKFFGGLPAMNGVSLKVAPGERRLIIGPNGARETFSATAAPSVSSETRSRA
jgi:branched-chain amino acid transport system ATP-binding protein